MSAIATFTGLPVPPSANALWSRRRGGGMRLSDAYETWKRSAGWLVNMARQKPVHGPYAISIRVRTGATGCDIDNLIKASSDLMQTMRIIDNDRLCQRVEAAWSADAELLDIEIRSAA